MNTKNNTAAENTAAQRINAFHQGDVQGRRIAALPREAKAVENTPLAYGEISGHCHVLTGDVELFELNGTRYAAVGSDGACLQHVQVKAWEATPKGARVPGIADHKEVLLTEGWYAFGIQREYDPYAGHYEATRD